MQSTMHLKILLPFEIFSDKKNITRIIAETQEGSFGILPRRLDCVAALIPGILTYEIESEGEIFVAINEGVLVKMGTEVVISVRSAVSGKDLRKLRKLVEDEFVHLSEQDSSVKSILTKMESSFLSRLSELHHD
jgi:F-type H+-transporting ATPase subunit epsilon